MIYDDILIGKWNLKSINFLKGKLISLLISNFHDIEENNWAGFLHASVVHKSDKSFVIVGSSGSGKTTLCKLLIDAGYNLISDDIAPLNQDGTFAYFPNALSIKESGFDSILASRSNYSIYDSKTFKGKTKYLFPKNQIIKNDFFKSKIIVKIKFVENSEFKIKYDSKIEILNEFINDSFIPRNNRSVKSFIKWFKNCKCLDITYSNFNDINKFLKNI